MLEYKCITYWTKQRIIDGVAQMKEDGWEVNWSYKVFGGSLFGPVSKPRVVEFKRGTAETEAEIKLQKKHDRRAKVVGRVLY